MNKDLKKQYEKALKWCEKARDILKVKRKWKIDHKERGYTQLDHHITWVKDGLKELEKKKSKEYDSLVKEFIQQAEAGRVAKETENKELSKMLTSNLAMLYLKIEVALGKRPPESVSIGKENLKKMHLEHYEKALKEAEQVQSALSKLSVDGHDFLGSVPLLIGTAKEHMKSGAGVAFALLSLGKVEAERPIQIKQQELYLKFKSKLAEAKSLKAEVSDFLSMNANLKQPESNKNLTEHVDSLEEIITVANQLVDQKKYGEAIEKLAEAKSHHKEVIGKLSGSDRKRFEAYSKAKNSFMDSYEAELDRIHKAQALRGADEGDAKKHLDEALKILKEAKIAADKAAKPEEFEVAEKSLDKIEPLVEKAIEASKTSKEEAERNLEKMSHWLLLLPAAERELQFMRTLAGTEVQQGKLEKLLLEAKSLLVRDPKTQMTTGYEDAWKKLQNYFEIVLEARRNFQEFSKASLPESITKLFDQIELAIDASKQVAPAFWVELTAQDLQESMDGIRKSIANKQPNAIEDGLETLTEFASNLSKTVGEQMDLKTEVYKLLESFKTHRQSLIDAKVPLLMLGPVDRLIKVAETTLLTAHEWAQASAKITVAFNLMKEVEQYHATKSKQWFECYELLVSYRNVAREFVMWPPTASKARMVIDDCNGLEQQFNTTLDYEACAKAFTVLQLKESYEALVKLKEGAPPLRRWFRYINSYQVIRRKSKTQPLAFSAVSSFSLKANWKGLQNHFRTQSI